MEMLCAITVAAPPWRTISNNLSRIKWVAHHRSKPFQPAQTQPVKVTSVDQLATKPSCSAANVAGRRAKESRTIFRVKFVLSGARSRAPRPQEASTRKTRKISPCLSRDKAQLACAGKNHLGQHGSCKFVHISNIRLNPLRAKGQ